MPSISVLTIPDAHATPHHNNSRFDLLGQFIVDRQPDVIVNIGDMADMPSLSSYDKGKKSFEGRRYRYDVASVLDAQERMFKPLHEYNKQQKANKQKQYKPKLYLTIGNHEHRISRATNNQPELDGAISVEDLKYEHFGWDVSPFLQPVFINGVAFSHYFTSGVMGRAIGGEHVGHSLITKRLHSCVQGHSHLREFTERTAADGKKMLGLTVGCFLDTDQVEEYAGEANKMWYRGLVMLNDVENGEFEPEFISVKQLRKKYG